MLPLLSLYNAILHMIKYLNIVCSISLCPEVTQLSWGEKTKEKENRDCLFHLLSLSLFCEEMTNVIKTNTINSGHKTTVSMSH